MTLAAEKTLNIKIRFRPATEDDLELLEWYGQYTHFRRVFRTTYQDQCAGKRLMLVSDLNGFPIGQIFVLLHVKHKRKTPDAPRIGYLYALRVMDHLRGLGIGTQLILQAEAVLADRGYHRAIISAAKTNHRARQLYERIGYCVYSESPGKWKYINHLGQTVHVHEPCWMLEKKLC